MQWNEREIIYLQEHANEGATAIARGLFAEFGRKRSETSIKRFANRQGISLRRWAFCAHCGRQVSKLNRRTGLCALCSAREQKETSRQAWLKAKQNSEKDLLEIQECRRAANTYRQRLCRL